MDAEAAQELAAAADDSGRVLMVNFQRRFSFAVTRAQEIMLIPRGLRLGLNRG